MLIEYYILLQIEVLGKAYKVDEMTNVTPKVISLLNSNLHLKKNHPLYHLKKRIIDYMYNRYINARGNPLFSIHNNISPIVSTQQNFDSLLIANDHVCRLKSDTYYLNSDYLLRTHTSAHQVDLIKMGLDNFIVMGDVYRRDVVDKTHFMSFHQAEGVRLVSKEDIFGHLQNIKEYRLFENRDRTDKNQGVHSDVTIKFLTYDLKSCLEELAYKLFGKGLL